MASNLIYLASGSPRRRELLDQIGVKYQVLAAPVDESVGAGEAPAAYVTRLADAKAYAGFSRVGADSIVLAADTAVVVEGRILGKPADRQDGLAMLAALSGRTHRVLTAVAVATFAGVHSRLSESEVTFRCIASREAAAYWETGEPCDKAGGYAIQGRAAVFITQLRGSYSGVMGLPLFETAQLLGVTFAAGCVV